MICVRCGYCCKNMLVVIIDDPDLGFAPGNLLTHEGRNESCKHLLGDSPGQYACGVHDREWYPDTPCYSHTQIERGNRVCRMGEYILAEWKKAQGNS